LWKLRPLHITSRHISADGTAPLVVTLGYWVCAVLLLIAATLPRNTATLGLIGSGFGQTTYGLQDLRTMGGLAHITEHV